MRLTYLTSLFLVAVSSSYVVQAKTPEVHDTALKGGPMMDCAGLPCVQLTLTSGKQLKMLIDTGDAQSVLDAEVAKDLGLDVQPVKGGDGKVVPGYGQATVSGAKIGDGLLGDVKLLVMDLASLVTKGEVPPSDGSLTYTVFKDRVLEMDYVQKLVRFSAMLTSEAACPGKCQTLTTPTFGKQGPPVLVATGFAVNGKAITAQIDSLFSGTMLIYPHAVEKLGLTKAAKSAKTKMFPYTDGGVDMVDGGPAAEAFQGRMLDKDGAVYFATPKVHLPDGKFDGTVGQGLLQHSVLVMDLKGMRVWMKG